jgi:hypothetical protein
METKHNRPLNEVDYTNFTLELISLPNQDSKLDYLNFISSYHETNKSLYKQIIEKIQNLITDLTNDFMQSPQFKNSKLEWFELIEQYEKYYRNPNRGQFTVRDLERLKDLVYQFNDEVLENKIDNHYRFLDMFLSFIEIDVNEVFNFISENELYRNVRDEIDRYGVSYFQYFQRELRNKLEKQENWKFIEVDIKDRFLPMIHKYYEWYEINKEETKKFEPKNFYEWIYEVMRSTEQEINKWFMVEQQAVPESRNIELVEEKTFIEYLSHPQREQFAESLRKEFENDKGGKSFAIMIKSLKDRTILNLIDGDYSKFYSSMESYFNRDIGTESNLNKYKRILDGDLEKNKNLKNDIQSIDNRVQTVLKSVKK